MFTPRTFSLVVFRILDPSGDLEVENELNAAFIKRSNEEHKIMLTQTSVGGKQCVRVAIGSRETEERHLKESWDGIIRPLIVQSREDVKVSPRLFLPLCKAGLFVLTLADPLRPRARLRIETGPSKSAMVCISRRSLGISYVGMSSYHTSI